MPNWQFAHVKAVLGQTLLFMHDDKCANCNLPTIAHRCFRPRARNIVRLRRVPGDSRSIQALRIPILWRARPHLRYSDSKNYLNFRCASPPAGSGHSHLSPKYSSPSHPPSRRIRTLPTNFAS